jgi:hypothetical protein
VNVKITPNSSSIEITGSLFTSSIDVTGSALAISYFTPGSGGDAVDIFQLQRKHPSNISATNGTTIQLGYYGKSKNANNISYGKDVYTLKTTGSFGFDGIVSYKKQIYAGNLARLVLTEKKSPGVHEEFELSSTLNDEKFYKRTYMMTGQTVGANQNGYLYLLHAPSPQDYIEINTNESVQIVANIIARAGNAGVRSRAFLINGVADTLDAAGTIAGGYAIVNSIGQPNTAPPNNWNVVFQFVNDYNGGQTNYIRIQVYNNTVVNETINWSGYIELISTTATGTARFGV